MHKRLIQHIKKVTQQHPNILAIYLYGSKAIGSATGLSDTDLGIIMFERFKDPKKQLDYELDLEDQFSKLLPGENPDVRVINNAPILVKGKIITEGKCLYAANDIKLSDFKENIILRYLDFKIDYDPMLEEYYKNQLDDR